MDLFKAQLERISRQLSGLSASQKMLTGTLVTIMVMTLILWGRYAAEPEMEPLFSHPIAADELTQVTEVLQQHGIKPSGSGDTILVPAAEKLHAYSVLAFAKVLPHVGKDAYEEIAKNGNPFQSESLADRMWNRARDKTLGQLIEGFPDVASAQVMIAEAQEARIGHNTEPVASVTILTHSGKGSPQLVDAAASLVEGAQTGLERSKIRVVINGHAMRVPDDKGDDAIANLRTAAHDEELKIEDRIRKQFDYMSGFLVTVTVQLNTQRVDQHKTSYDAKGTLSKEKEIHSVTEETTNPAASPGEAGAVPNTGLAVNSPSPAAGGAGGTTREESDTKYEILPALTDTHTQNAPGETTPIGAAVHVPYEYYLNMYKHFHPNATDLSGPEVTKYVNDELVHVKEQVQACASLKPEAVVVNWYLDPSPAPTLATTASGTISASIIGSAHVKEIVLGALALVSLFMVSTLVKKGTPATALSAPAFAGVGMIETDAAETPVGEVGTADPSLDGLELDPEAIRTQQVAQQVSSLVKENPDSAAALVKRWMNRA